MQTADADEVARIRVELPAGSDAVLTNACAVFARQVESRCAATVTNSGGAPLTVALAVDPAIGPEGFRIGDRPGGGIEVAGQNARSVLYGLGKLLRTSGYSGTGFTPGSWRGESVPQKPIRGIYFATHFHNFYHDGPVEEIRRYVEELALWGCNNLMVWYDMHHFNGFSDPEAVAFRARLHAVLAAARGVGMDVSLIVIGNEAYGNSPAPLRATPGAGRGGYYPCAVCPSKAEGKEYILKIVGEEFDWVADVQPWAVCIWPFDQGGCGCSDCQPWATNGFLKCAKPIARMAREKLPGVKVILSNWYYKANETTELGRILAAGNEPWVDFVMGPVPGTEIPAVNFPEISMLGVQPWGGYGAIPVPRELQGKYGNMADLQGGWSYSEGLFEDMNKIAMLQLYWNPGQPALETIREYARYEFAPETADDVVAVVRILEKNFRRRANIPADAVQAFELAEKVDAKLPKKARTGWRWRILHLRALIDKEMHLTKGALTGKVLRDAFDELRQIYFAENALDGWLKPPVVKDCQTPAAKAGTNDDMNLDPRTTQ